MNFINSTDATIESITNKNKNGYYKEKLRLPLQFLYLYITVILHDRGFSYLPNELKSAVLGMKFVPLSRAGTVP